MTNSLKFAFFGTPHFVIPALEALKEAGYIPALVVTAPDKPVGRKHIITPPAVKVWAMENNIPVLQPTKLKDNIEFYSQLAAIKPQLFIVAGYGKIIPQNILDLPEEGTLNVHPSLLPLHRGPAPVEGQILSGDKEVGVSIIKLDAEMDHGPIIDQEFFSMPDPLPTAPELDALLWPAGARLLVQILPEWMADAIIPQEQDHSLATFTKKLTKEDGLLDLSADPVMNFRKIKAYDPWPGTYFFHDRDGVRTRVIIKDAELVDGQLKILRVVPEGKKEMSYTDFERNFS